MLTRIEQEAERRKIRTLATTAQELGDIEALMRELRPASGAGITRAEVKVLGTGAAIQREAGGDDRLIRALTKNTDKPLAMLIDEAHRLDPQVGGRLLPAVQETRRRNRPLLLVLAGTPNLLAHLRGMNATFFERARIQPLGLLSRQEAREALQRPFEKEGWKIAPQSLEEVVADSQGYPYFVQMWGEELWESAAGVESREIGDGEVARARRRVMTEKDGFYQGRQEELQSKGCREAAVAIARACQETPALTREETDAIIERTLTRDRSESGVERQRRVDSVRQTLQDEGYLWAPRGLRTEKGLGAYVPGIPSLMNSLLETPGQGPAAR